MKLADLTAEMVAAKMYPTTYAIEPRTHKEHAERESMIERAQSYLDAIRSLVDEVSR